MNEETEAETLSNLSSVRQQVSGKQGPEPRCPCLPGAGAIHPGATHPEGGVRDTRDHTGIL